MVFETVPEPIVPVVGLPMVTAVNTELPPSHIVAGWAVTLAIVGSGFTVTVVVATLVQPLSGSKPLTV